MGANSGQAMTNGINLLGGVALNNAAASTALDGAGLAAAADIAGGQFEATLATQGGQYSADVYRSYESAVQNQTAYSIAVSRSNFARSQQVLGQQITSQMTHNQAVMGNSGLSYGSKSYLAVANSNLHAAETQIVNMNNIQLANEQELAYQGAISQTRLENQARGAEYAGQVQASQALYSAQVKSALANYEGEAAAYSATSSSYKDIGTALGGAISLLK